MCPESTSGISTLELLQRHQLMDIHVQVWLGTRIVRKQKSWSMVIFEDTRLNPAYLRRTFSYLVKNFRAPACVQFIPTLFPRLSISRRSLFASFLQVISHENPDLAASFRTYQEAKDSAIEYRQARDMLRAIGGPLWGWVVSSEDRDLVDPTRVSSL